MMHYALCMTHGQKKRFYRKFYYVLWKQTIHIFSNCILSRIIAVYLISGDIICLKKYTTKFYLKVWLRLRIRKGKPIEFEKLTKNWFSNRRFKNSTHLSQINLRSPLTAKRHLSLEGILTWQFYLNSIYQSTKFI